jgi:hypothetical protein
MLPHRCRSSVFRGIRARPNGTYYAELHVGGFRLTLGMYDTPKLVACAYDAAAWHFWRPRRDLNFPDVQSIEEAEFFSPPLRLLDNEDHHHHCQAQLRLAIFERDEEQTRCWRA